MQKIIKQVTRKFQQFNKFWKLKFGKNPSSEYIIFQDFLVYERSARKLGCSYLRCEDSLSKILPKLHARLFQISLFILLILELISFVLTVKTEQVDLMIDNILFIGIIYVIMVKVYVVFVYKRATILEVLEILEKHFPRSANDQVNFKAHKYLKILKFLEKFFYATYFVHVTQISLMPFLHQYYGVLKSINVEWEFIIALSLPLDDLHPILYGLACILQSWIIATSTLYVISTDLIFASLMQILAMNFNIISQKYTQLDVLDEKDAILELKKLVDAHQQLIEVSEKLENIFSPHLLINALGSIIALCTASFLSVTGINSYYIAKFFLFPLLIPIQIFTQCYFSQLLIDSSISISSSAYNMKWYNRSVKFQRLTLQVMVRAQKAQTVTAWKFFDMSLENFQWIISTSYSYFSVLKGTYGS